MSKILKKKIVLSESNLVETRFFLTIKLKNPLIKNPKINSSFCLVFKVVNGFGEEVESSKLGDFVVENILEKHILKYHPPNTYYDRLQLRIASETKQVLETVKYDYPTKIGTADLSSPSPSGSGDPSGSEPKKIFGNYSCSFKKETRRGQLILRIKNMVAYPKMDYFINDLFQDSLKLDPEGIELQLVGLTLNNVFEGMYDYFDEIIEKISI